MSPEINTENLKLLKTLPDYIKEWEEISLKLSD